MIVYKYQVESWDQTYNRWFRVGQFRIRIREEN